MTPGIHAYPQELVTFIFNRWKDPLFVQQLSASGIDPSCQLPDRTLLERIISISYQASLMREEERPVMFRLIIAAPELFPPDEGPPTGLHRLLFNQPRPFEEYELHRLAPAADFDRTMIGLSLEKGKRVQIWGLILTERGGCRRNGVAGRPSRRFLLVS